MSAGAVRQVRPAAAAAAAATAATALSCLPPSGQISCFLSDLLPGLRQRLNVELPPLHFLLQCFVAIF